MASPFDAVCAAAGRTHDAVMGETFEFRPMTTADRNVNSRSGVAADPDRAVVQNLRAVWGDPSARAESGAVRTIGVEPERPGHATTRPFVSLQLSLLPYDPKRDDRILRVNTGNLYRIAEVLPSQPGFARLDLNLIK